MTLRSFKGEGDSGAQEDGAQKDSGQLWYTEPDIDKEAEKMEEEKEAGEDKEVEKMQESLNPVELLDSAELKPNAEEGINAPYEEKLKELEEKLVQLKGKSFPRYGSMIV